MIFGHIAVVIFLVFSNYFLYIAEWNVLYTAQMTQKSKKYQSGILKLVSRGSFHMQVGSSLCCLPQVFYIHFLGIAMQFKFSKLTNLLIFSL